MYMSFKRLYARQRHTIQQHPEKESTTCTLLDLPSVLDEWSMALVLWLLVTTHLYMHGKRGSPSHGAVTLSTLQVPDISTTLRVISLCRGKTLNHYIIGRECRLTILLLQSQSQRGSISNLMFPNAGDVRTLQTTDQQTSETCHFKTYYHRAS